MSANKPHPHAEVLRAIADGVPLDEFETSKNEVYWDPIGHLKISDFFAYDRYIRRKPQHIMVNGTKFHVGADGLAEATAFITRLFMEAGYGQST